MQEAEQSSIGRNNDPNIRIAIIGAGVAGLPAARELFRCGYINIDIYESSDRIAGRNYSRAVNKQQCTVFKMGAMRMPFLDNPGRQNSVLDYYRKLFQITTQVFPNPGSKVVNTGIYLNNGYGSDTNNPYDSPRLDIWSKDLDDPPTSSLQKVYHQWDSFASMVIGEFQARYEGEEQQ